MLHPRGLSFSESLDALIATYRASSAIRPEVLFRHFLPTGYRATTLSSVAEDFQDLAILAKVHLGMIVTLYDDLADHPEHRNSELLKELYTLNVEEDRLAAVHLNEKEKVVFELGRYLFLELTALLREFPHYRVLVAALRFDIEQFYSCNKYSELMSSFPAICNLEESRTLGSHNMGIVAAGTIDLMASSGLHLEELGKAREVLHLGQRLGRISNLVFTFNRELSEGDSTNEILISKDPESYRKKLLEEFSAKATEIRSHSLHTFSTQSYAEGLEELHRLHAALEGRI
ncbi:hypothetical protein [Bdellovibrio sp. HCB2-146]|uniref:hypothetical protein n=1 Tax=Bdellovibrio sp. HCB2-146 TaxID=3394362 RepID=UPI0039BC34D0